MENKMIYESKIDRAFFENGETFVLRNCGIEITIKGEDELFIDNSAAYYFEDPYYKIRIGLKDLDNERIFSDFKVQVEKVLANFTYWLNDTQGVKMKNPVFFKGYVNGKEVNREGQLVGPSGTIAMFNPPQEKTVPKEEVIKIFKELDDSNGEIEYLNQVENLYEKRREIFLSKNTMGNYFGLYAFLHDVVGKKTQKELDDYIRLHPKYDSTNDRQTNRKDQTYNETIFTWLRNKIGHLDSDNINFNEVSEEIDEWYGKLYEITLTAIEDKKMTFN